VLAKCLSAYAGRADVIVLALPRGGVPVGFEVAQALGAPLDILLVRKLGVPGREELAMGAIASGGIRLINEQVLAAMRSHSPDADIEAILHRTTAEETRELLRREAEYRGERQRAPELRGKTVIVVDDGLATGATMRAAVFALKQRAPARIIVAVPVGSPETCAELREEVDEMVCVIVPEDFHSVGQLYEDFPQTSDEEVHELLARAAGERLKKGE
jgi:putative phosphoribosyl transferase